MTAYEKRHGKKWLRCLPEFGEMVMAFTTRGCKAEERFYSGIYVGMMERTSEFLVATSSGVYKAGTIRRVDMGQRGNAKFVAEMQGLPWKMRPGITFPGEEEGVQYERVRIGAQAVQREELPVPIPIAGEVGAGVAAAPRRVYLRRE
eukprot:6486813-Amphidinium_carterae.1